MLLSICLSFQAAVIPVAAADQTDCAMDMSSGMNMSAPPVDDMAHPYAGHSMMSDADQADGMAGCCDAEASARTDCLAVFDCHRCSASASVTSFAITGEFLTVIPVSSASAVTLVLLSPLSPPSDRWRPPINA